jgi:hypothetical protein
MSEVLETIYSKGTVKKIGDVDVTIKDIALGDLPKLLKIFSSFVTLAAGKNGLSKEEFVSMLLDKLAQDFDSVIELFIIATDLDLESVKKLNAAGAAMILDEVVSKNADFLFRFAVPAVKKMVENMKRVSQPKSKP